MPGRTARKLFLLAEITALVVGCHSAAKPLPTAAPTEQQSSTPRTTGAPQPQLAASSPTQSLSTEARFEPPFPNRTDLFEAPRNGQSIVRRDEEQGGTVELKGFVDVNGPQVVLAIDGVLSPIPEGGEKYGVQVISIKPPQVVLQRGRSRWTASLE